MIENSLVTALLYFSDNIPKENGDYLIKQYLYSPNRDTVVVPMKEQYQHINEYYSTTFHELIHSTGHKKRLNRLETSAVASFGSETYSKEELVAEIGSATLLNILEIETQRTFTNSVAYIQNWLIVLRNDNRFIISASSQAEKAIDYILN